MVEWECGIMGMMKTDAEVLGDAHDDWEGEGSSADQPSEAENGGRADEEECKKDPVVGGVGCDEMA